MRKVLGKIKSAEFGRISDYPMYIGLLLTFSLSDGGVVGDGGKHCVNASSECKWENEDKGETYIKAVTDTYKTLVDAKVMSVSELINVPVEVTLDGNMFKDFRILTEVL
ncbi:MAG: hypothetical protein IKI94_08895 [Ruminococcus sp.]|nr:hypothetical protein [Ruminococcus sp.]